MQVCKTPVAVVGRGLEKVEGADFDRGNLSVTDEGWGGSGTAGKMKQGDT